MTATEETSGTRGTRRGRRQQLVAFINHLGDHGEDTLELPVGYQEKRRSLAKSFKDLNDIVVEIGPALVQWFSCHAPLQRKKDIHAPRN